jgi:hypothetical protein
MKRNERDTLSWRQPTREPKVIGIFFDPASQICLLYPVYAGQKSQKSNLTKIPAKTVGTVKYSEIDNETKQQYYLVRFVFQGKPMYAKVCL